MLAIAQSKCNFFLRTIISSVSVCCAIIVSAAGFNTAAAQTLDNLGKVFESKQERYEREDRERKIEAAKNSQIQESILHQQAELKAIEEEKKRLLSGSLATTQPKATPGAGTQVYVVAQCAPCLKTIGVLDALEVPYTIRQVDSSISTQQLYVERFGRGEMPVVDAANGVIRGYRPARLKQMFNKSCGATKSPVNRSFNNSTGQHNNAKQKYQPEVNQAGSSTTPPAASLPGANKTAPKSDFDVSTTISE